MRIALGEDDDVAPGVQVCGQPLGGLGVELVDRGLVAARVVGGLGRDRVDQRLLDLVAAQVGAAIWRAIERPWRAGGRRSHRRRR